MFCIELRICMLSSNACKTTNRSLFQPSFSFLAPFSCNSAQLFHSFFLTVSFCLFLAYAHSLSKNMKAVRKGLFLIRWNYIDMVVACCSDSGVLRAIDREMLEWFDGKHRPINVHHSIHNWTTVFRSIAERVALSARTAIEASIIFFSLKISTLQKMRCLLVYLLEFIVK